MPPLGHRVWAIPDGYIPAWSNGPGPELTSHESFAVLNTNDEAAQLTVDVYYADREPVTYSLEVPPRRTLHVRFNDLAEPERIPLGTEFASVVRSTVPVVVQHTRLDSRHATNALLSTIAFPADDSDGEAR